jgi:hypothetical protein
MDMYSDLESLVNYEIHSLGLDFSNPEHVDKYWEVMLSDD